MLARLPQKKINNVLNHYPTSRYLQLRCLMVLNKSGTIYQVRQIVNAGKTIGSGTYGKVHLGLHILTGERVAVKIIEKLKLSHNDLQRVYREISILQKIMHPSLIQLYEIIETDKSLLFITEYMQNGELFNYII